MRLQKHPSLESVGVPRIHGDDVDFQRRAALRLVWRFVEARRSYRQVLPATPPERLGPNHPFVAGGLDSLADVVSRRGEIESHPVLKEALRLRTRPRANSPAARW